MTEAVVEHAYGKDYGFSRDEAVANCKKDMNFFGMTCIPNVFKFAFPPILMAVWQLLCRAVAKPTGQDKIALGLPRGFAKTLLLKLFVVYCVLFTDRQFILIVCNTATLAENFISDVFDTLSSSNILRLFGNWQIAVEKDTQELKKFTFKGRSIIIAGIGSGSAVRGISLKYARPDVILMDDMQSKEESASATDSDKQLNWMLGTLMMANDKTRCLFVFLGNMYPSEGCILKKLKNAPDWVSFITGAILEDGESLWPELRSIDSLLDELAAVEAMGHPEIFYSEVMNDDEAGSRSTVDFTKLNIWSEKDEDNEAIQHEGGWIIIDPALAKTASDDCGIGVFYLFNGEPVLWHVVSGKFTEQQKVDKCIEFCLTYKLMAIVVEAVAYQESLCFWMDKRKNQLGLHSMRILTVNPAGISKNSRILAAAKQLTAATSRIWLKKSVRSIVTHQFVYWNPLKTKNKDDVLDLLAYAWKVINQYGVLLLSPFELINDDSGSSFSDSLQLDF